MYKLVDVGSKPVQMSPTLQNMNGNSKCDDRNKYNRINIADNESCDTTEYNKMK